ncbi:flagellar hook-basal body complex protein FliE [Effusibacillus lacus]|uniref:Flagellar hook-basal body complex protein FliE n=1 Tax=Effusibacillus lacus TaxID=1348429 RepID=A0A292YSI2_9BACL|nr:flagellar hook-basal body complex protein FliE [Effusibacillus lacus]TCS76036.1 flagellar hook-basal body complex protein FliE [Effusibacillus lacus]GAX91445.1 flagellar hook-basal body complex protein FliE [Effusibacillus lacus]
MIDKVTNMLPVAAPESAAPTKPASGQSFSAALANALDQVGNMEIQSSAMTQRLAAGQGTDLHSVLIAGEKASLALQLTVQVRNKAVEAYQEIMRMQM